MTSKAQTINKSSLVLLIGALAALGPLSIDMYLPSFPVVVKELHTTAGLVSGTLATFFIGLCLGQMIYGPLSDRVGRKKPLLLGLAIYVAASLGCFFVTSIESLLLLRFFQALGSCAGMVVGRAMIRDLFEPEETAKVFSLVMLTMGAAPILAPLMGQFIADGFGWRGIFGFMATFAAVVWLYVLRLIPADPKAEGEQGGRPSVWRGFRSVLEDKNFVGFALSGTLVQAGLFAYITGSPTLFIEGFGMSPKMFSILFGFNAFGLILASQLNNWLLARYPYDQVLQKALEVAALSGGVLAVFGMTKFGGLFVIVPLFFFLASLGLVFPNSTAGALAGQGHQAGTASAVLGVIQYGGAALASAVVGMLHHVTQAPLELTVGFCGISALVAYRGLLSARVVQTPTAI